MVTKELIQKEIELFPEPYLEELLDFIRFLKGKASRLINFIASFHNPDLLFRQPV
jgi:hypothetical protein